MLFGLKKIITYWLMPVPLCLLLLVVGLLLLRSTRWPRAGRRLLIVSTLLFLLFSNRQVSLLLLRPLETQYAAIPEIPAGAPLPAALAECRTIVVLGGGHSDAPGLSALQKLGDISASRLIEAVRLMRLLPEAKLIVSGPAAGKGATHASVLAAAAISLGVDPSRIVQIDTARDTDDESQALKRLIGASAPFALVTSAWHMPRASALMRRAGLHPLPCPANFLAADREFRATDLLFDASSLERSNWAVYERLGTIWARLQGKI